MTWHQISRISFRFTQINMEMIHTATNRRQTFFIGRPHRRLVFFIFFRASHESRRHNGNSTYMRPGAHRWITVEFVVIRPWLDPPHTRGTRTIYGHLSFFDVCPYKRTGISITGFSGDVWRMRWGSGRFGSVYIGLKVEGISFGGAQSVVSFKGNQTQTRILCNKMLAYICIWNSVYNTLIKNKRVN